MPFFMDEYKTFWFNDCRVAINSASAIFPLIKIVNTLQNPCPSHRSPFSALRVAESSPSYIRTLKCSFVSH